VSAFELPPRALWRLGAGFGLWSSALATLYALHAVGCAFGWSGPALRAAMAVLLAAHLATLGALLVIAPRPAAARGATAALVARVGLWTLWAALISTFFGFAPALLLTACV
jgi:hypothetical protein